MEEFNVGPTDLQTTVLRYRGHLNILNAGGRGSGKTFGMMLAVLDHLRLHGPYARPLVRAEVGATLTDLRLITGIAHLRKLARRGHMTFEPAIPPAVPRTPRDARPTHSGTRERPCMRCRVPFQSQGNHHRLCHDCNKRAATMGPLDSY